MGAGLTAALVLCIVDSLGWKETTCTPWRGRGPHAGDGWVMWRRPPCGRGLEPRTDRVQWRARAR